MIELKELEKYLAEMLETEAFDDYCVNGIQIEGRSKIERIVTGVSASARMFEAAIEKEADAILLHHGLFWKNTPQPFSLTGIMKQRVKIILDAEISLLGYHLPLDAHREIGNNALLAKAFELKEITFVPVSGIKQPIAAVGNLPRPLPFPEFITLADKLMGTGGVRFDFSKKQVNRLFILSGGGGGDYDYASEAGADLMITGELNESNVRPAEELELSIYAPGHYISEMMGIRALGEHLAAKFNIVSEFIDIPNPV